VALLVVLLTSFQVSLTVEQRIKVNSDGEVVSDTSYQTTEETVDFEGVAYRVKTIYL
jgi:hypothetical protein